MRTLFLLLAFVALDAFAIRPIAAPPDRTVRLMSYNVRTGRGMDNVLYYDRTAAVIRAQNVAVVALQEVDSATNRSYGYYTAGELAKRLGMHATFGTAINHDVGRYGVGLLSAEKPLRTAQIKLPGTSEKRTALLAEFAHYYVVTTHWAYEAESQRVRSLNLINRWLKKLRDKPIFVLGDLNAIPASASLQAMCGLGTVLSDTTVATYPADKPREVIDYIFGWRNGFSFRVDACSVVDAPTASDHRPVVVEVAYFLTPTRGAPPGTR